MRRKITWTIISGLMALLLAGPARAAQDQADIQKLAATMASRLAALCPAASRNDVEAHAKCTNGLRDASFIPFSPKGILFGGDQPELKLSKKQLTHFKPAIFQLMYMSLFTFSGHWSVDTDAREHVSVIHIDADFRNALPPGEFPYPFWHSADKWNAYETATELKFYLDHDGRVFVVTRSQGGAAGNRGTWTHVMPPAFDGHWQWTDASGQLQPHVSLFSNRYSAANPYLAPLDQAYRNFAAEARKGTCLECHAPNNESGMDHLVLLQTPMHAAGEIDRVLKEVKSGEMPHDDLGLPKEIDPRLRAAILTTGEAFRGQLARADAWETQHPHAFEHADAHDRPSFREQNRSSRDGQ
jgi:hypothetical protein